MFMILHGYIHHISTGLLGTFRELGILTLTFYVNPPQQLVTIDCIWNTSWPNFTGSATINQLTAPALQSYINGIAVGQPINILDMEGAFRDAVSGVGPLYYLTALTFIVKINGIVTAPTAGTKTIYGDPESYFYAAANSVTVTQG